MPDVHAADISSEAMAFLHSLAREKNWDEQKLNSRSEVMLSSISSTGTWTPAFDELEHGARMAWRNNARCIGRLFWPSLRVRDLRHVSDPSEINAALIEHLAIATNGGKIQPLLTVFAPTTKKGPAVRIWNHQLLGYAGYEQEDGSILGDPKNAEFTKEARKLGWEGDGTAFDLLPWIIQKRGEPPQLFPPPRSHALEVTLSHPNLDWFTELGLKWYAVPILSDMLLRIGGVDFPVAPFNGWYMGTEIGSRDLGDEQRYNTLPLIAERMGLDRSRSASMWKDRALVELNTAVLHSFEKSGVRIVDHHRASSEFMEFAAREMNAGRAVSADWSWIVPPMSGSATPVFHQLWQDRKLLPDYVQQPKAWLQF
jgi:nitric-oxide synthase